MLQQYVMALFLHSRRVRGREHKREQTLPLDLVSPMSANDMNPALTLVRRIAIDGVQLFPLNYASR